MRRLAVTLTGLVVVLAGCTDDGGMNGAPTSGAAGTSTGAPDRTTADPSGSSDAAGTSSASAAAPALDVEVVADGLQLPWDVQPLDDGSALVTEKGGRLLHLVDGEEREIALGIPDLFVGSETGLMGLALSADFATARTIFLCHGTADGDQPRDIRVTRWTLDDGLTRASADGDVVTGLPITSGRHGGCRLLLDGETLWIGTGDAADEANPQSLESLGGKVLRVTTDGDPAPGSPAVRGADPLISTYGHRNVQGLALQPGTGEVWTVEHGPDVDDEVNIERPGSNYGWAPGPGYDEGAPMTDLERFPGAVEAAWSSGDPTHATSGAVFLDDRWGAWAGDLAVAELKGSGVTVLDVEGDKVVGQTRIAELDGTHGRLRSLRLDADGVLWVTTSNGQGDEVLRVTPRDRG